MPPPTLWQTSFVPTPRETIGLEPDTLPCPVPLDDEGDLRLGQTLGEGSMGQVVSAWQEGLGRHVAVKRPHPTDDGTCARFLRLEARATGLLEHPNIVPVHDLRDEGEIPWMVMKQVSGDLWSDLLADPERCLPYLEGRDGLALHLGVLIAVCRALSFAHERGVLHRDVKPENVMLGRFGEVYLLDWGVAVALRPGLGLPLAADQRSPAGTPCFMPPELARGDGGAQTERSDVFLVGAALHFLLGGQPLHEGETLLEVLRNARDGRRTPLGAVPAELSQLVERCTALDPAERPASVDEVRIALHTFLRRRTAARVVDVAEQRRREFEDLVRSERAGEAHDPRLRTLATEARFGYLQTLQEWPDDARALQGLLSLRETLFGYELHRENADAARDLLAELGDPPELGQALAELEARLAERAEAAAELEHQRWEMSPHLSSRTRVQVGLAMGSVSMALLLGLGWVDRQVGVGWPELLACVGASVLVGVVGGLVGLARPTNTFGRTHAAVTLGMTLGVVVHWGAAYWIGMSLHEGITAISVMIAWVLCTVGLVRDRSVLGSGLCYLVAVPALILWPGVLFEVFGLANGAAFFVYAANAWREA